MNAVDASVAIAGFAAWHEAHEAARRVVSAGAGLPAHAAIETYSVLTRLPEPFRFSPDTARTLILQNFTQPFLLLSDAGYRALAEIAPAVSIIGGAIYDGVIAATAKEAEATLLTRDARAIPVYDALGVPWEFVD
ncbi:MAG: PIN domain-containing protein [Actinomycetota bacterium]